MRHAPASIRRGLLASGLLLTVWTPLAPAQAHDELKQFLVEHDRLLCEQQFDELKQFYAPDFLSADLGIAGRDDMMRQWQAVALNYCDVILSTEIMRIEESGDHFAVSACRPFRAKDRQGEEYVNDDFCQTLIVRRKNPTGFELVQLFEIEHEKLSGCIDHGYRSKDLAFTAKVPEGWLTIPHRVPGSHLRSSSSCTRRAARGWTFPSWIQACPWTWRAPSHGTSRSTQDVAGRCVQSGSGCSSSRRPRDG